MQAQEEALHGKITNNTDVEGIHILNTSSRYNAITDQNGNFSILVKPLDTLLFSSIKYMPEKVVVTEAIFEKGVITVQLAELVNELDEVLIGPNLSGNLSTDLRNIKTEKPINFDDVGIPGFKGEHQEKIVPLGYAVIPLSVNIEALYKHISGYYTKLRTRRKWENENRQVAHILHFYSPSFFRDTYAIPENKVYDFMLFCMETTELKTEYKNENYATVLQIFKEKAKEYTARLSENDK